MQAEINKVERVGSHEFSFKVGTKEHVFQAASPTARDGWQVAIESAMNHAKGLQEDMDSSSGYKETLSSLGKF